MKPSRSLFWKITLGVLALLVVAAVVVIWRGGTPALRARTVTPAEGATSSTQPRIAVTFARPMNRESLNGKVFIDPAVPFELLWLENEMRILPLTPLAPDTPYRVTVGPGARDSTGTEMGGTLEWTFRTRQPLVAYIRPTTSESAGELWLSRRDGSGAARLSGAEQVVTSFTPVPDGGALLYTVVESDGTALWLVELNGETLVAPRLLIAESNSHFHAPRYNPAGDMVAIEVRRGAPDAPAAIELRRPTDGSLAGIVAEAAEMNAHSAHWSPDGTKIAFLDSAAGTLNIFNFTTNYRVYPLAPLEIGQQPWSPEGTALVYLAEQSDGTNALVTRALADDSEQIVQPFGNPGAEPAWSPDGYSIAYSFAPAPDARGGRGLWLTSWDGAENSLVTGDPLIANSRPLWSPDGAWLLYNQINPAHGLNAPPTLWIVRPDGSDAHAVADAAIGAAWVP